jgi:hypothetical protein
MNIFSSSNITLALHFLVMIEIPEMRQMEI